MHCRGTKQMHNISHALQRLQHLTSPPAIHLLHTHSPGAPPFGCETPECVGKMPHDVTHTLAAVLVASWLRQRLAMEFDHESRCSPLYLPNKSMPVTGGPSTCGESYLKIPVGP
eukprot:scaffold123194_cov16-Tisochrysis_lutea.AAC.3